MFRLFHSSPRPTGLSRCRNPLRHFAPAAAELLEDRTLLTIYVVTAGTDVVQADGRLSLREAIQAANTNAAVYEAAAGQADATDIIGFDPRLNGAALSLSTGPLVISDRVYIGGPGGARGVTIWGGGTQQLFVIQPGARAEVHDLGMFGGKVVDRFGGAIANHGTLSLTNCVLWNNKAQQSGGGPTVGGGGGISNSAQGVLSLRNCTVYGNEGFVGGGIINFGTATVANSTVRDNLGGGGGGGILNYGSLSLSDSTISGNRASGGGGVSNSGASSVATLTNSTISGNTAIDIGGGGVYADGTLAVTNCTISGNAAKISGGGIYISAAGTATLRNATVVGNVADSEANAGGLGGGIAVSGEAILHNTLVAGNSRPVRFSPFPLAAADDVHGTLSPVSSFNMIGDARTAGGLSNGANGNIVGVDWETVFDPVLRDNGGATLTHKLLFRSPAVDAGTNDQALGYLDQRGGGFRRVLQARVDIGAYEAAPAADLVGFLGGGWWVGVTDGTKFTTTRWTTWSNVAWDALGQADFNADGRIDVYGLLDGSWWVALSTGTGYAAATRWAAWSNVDWQNVTAADLNGDGSADVLARLGGQWWAALSNGTAFDAPGLWASWAALDWREFFLTDLNGDHRGDLLGYARGQWWAGLSNGSNAFAAPRLFANWTDAAWQTLLVLDAEGDGKSDLAGLLNGQWWVASSGANFTTSRWAAWADVAWTDPRVGDFDGDGQDDVIARNGGNWWLGRSVFEAPTLFASWSNVVWQDVRVADFDGDGRDDLTGRYNGQWWVAKSTGAGSTTGLWGAWSEVAWRAVGAVDATGPPAVAGFGSSASRATVVAPALTTAAGDDEPFALFWAGADEDDEFAGRLFAAR